MKCNNSNIDNKKLLEMIKNPAIKISVCDVTLKLHLFKLWERFNITINDEMDLDELVELLYEARRDEGSDGSAEDCGSPATEQKSIETECAPDNCKPPKEMETAILKMNDRIAELEQELAKERSECKKWYHEYHVVKDMLESEAEYLRNAQKLSDEYFCELTKAQIELDVLREAIENISMKATEAKEYRLGNRKGAICRPVREGKHENT